MRLLIALSLLAPLPALAASFDCTRAGPGVEQRICANPALSALDEALAQAYADARQRGDEQRLQREQRRWHKYARNACEDDACLAATYAGRLAALSVAPQTPAVSDALYSLKQPACFYANNEEGMSCEGEAESSIHVTATGPERGWVRAHLWFFNGHSCSFDGAAVASDEGIRAVQEDEDPEFRCELLLRPTAEGVATEASEGCRMYCGARGSLDAIDLSRVD